jgi:hypothetical protein
MEQSKIRYYFLQILIFQIHARGIISSDTDLEIKNTKEKDNLNFLLFNQNLKFILSSSSNLC